MERLSERGRYRLVLWFMRDLTIFDRLKLFRLFGITQLNSNMEQQKLFGKIIDGTIEDDQDSKP